jgi:hypothetical protein
MKPLEWLGSNKPIYPMDVILMKQKELEERKK